MKMPHKIPERLQRVSESVKQRYGLTVRQPQSTNEMIELGHQMFELLMTTYQHLPGFVPISKKQQTHYIHQYIKYLRKDFTAIVYDTDNSPIAFGVTLPSMSMAFKKAKGKLFPFGIFHILGARKKNDTADLALVGVLEEWRRKGTHGLVFAESCKAVIAAGVKRIQITPMQEFNTNVLSLWKDFEQQVYKKRKTFKKVIS